MLKHLVFLVYLSYQPPVSYTADPNEGYVIVKSDTIYGKVEVNFDSGSVFVKQDSINRMFLSGVERVTFLNENRDSYLPVVFDGRRTFYKILVDGEHPLVTSNGVYFTLVDKVPVHVAKEKDLYDLFGKQNVKNYIFVRAVSLTGEEGFMEVFQYFNTHDNF